MMRNIYLEGEMGEKFGTHFYFNAPTVQDALMCLEANFSGIKKYFIDCHNDDIGFEIDVANNKLDYEAEMLMTLQEGDITITPIPAGSKSGPLKILAAIIIVALLWWNPGGWAGGVSALGGPGQAAVLYSPAWGGAAAGGGLNLAGMAAAGMALNLAFTGLGQMMAPDPATDADQDSSYLFNGAEQNIIQGDPVPVLYGMLRVPGQPLSFEIAGVNSRIDTLGFDYLGNSYGTNASAA